MMKICFSLLTNGRSLNKAAIRCMSSTSLLEIQQNDGVRRIILSDTKTKNCLSLDMVSKLREAITMDENDPKLRCIVITARGSVFSSGFNLKQLADPSNRKVFNDFNSVMEGIVKSPVPVISAVNGLAAAAGCQLVAQSDIAVCTSTSSFSTPGASFGVFCTSPGVPLIRCVGRKMGMHMLFTGLPLTAEEALRTGLVSHVCEPDQLEELIKTITDAIKSKSRDIIQLGKRFIYQQIEMNLLAAYKESATVMKENLELPDGEEGVRSFMEKRKPVWKS